MECLPSCPSYPKHPHLQYLKRKRRGIDGTNLRLLDHFVQSIRTPLLIHSIQREQFTPNLDLPFLTIPPRTREEFELVSRSFGGERESVDGAGDDDFARGGMRLSLVVLVSDPDHLRWEGLEEPLTESDWSMHPDRLVSHLRKGGKGMGGLT